MRFFYVLLLAASFLSRHTWATVLPRSAANSGAITKQEDTPKAPQRHASLQNNIADAKKTTDAKKPDAKKPTEPTAAVGSDEASLGKATQPKTSMGKKKMSLPSGFQEALCKTPHEQITPLGTPVIRYPKQAQVPITKYVKERHDVFGRAAAEWQFNLLYAQPPRRTTLKFKDHPDIAPLRPGAPTLISLYYPHPKPDQSRTQEEYLMRLRLLANLGEQVIIYASKDVAPLVKQMRSDKHWIVIDTYADIWKIPNNYGKEPSFEGAQRTLFAQMLKTGTKDWKPKAIYDDPFNSAVYNAKAFIMLDAVLRNPFGSERWVYMDAGLLRHNEDAARQRGQPWDMIVGKNGFLDNAKLDRSIKLTGDSGVVFPEYDDKPGRDKADINHKAFTDVSYQWQNKLFLANLCVGSSLGMLNYAARYMQAVETLSANGFYVGREEFVIPFVAVMYPNTVFSLPVQEMPKPLTDITLGVVIGATKHMLLSLARPFGIPLLPAIHDPISSRYCSKDTHYIPRGRLAAGSWNIQRS